MPNSERSPVLGVGALVTHQGDILLVQRGRPPHQGEWALPGGKVEWGESLQCAVEREIKEECGIEICAGKIVHHFEEIITGSNGEIDYHFVVIDLLATYEGGNLIAGDDAQRVAWFSLSNLDGVMLNHNTRRLLECQFPHRVLRGFGATEVIEPL